MGQEASGRAVHFPSHLVVCLGRVPRRELLPQAEVRVRPCRNREAEGALNRLLRGRRRKRVVVRREEEAENDRE